MCDCAGCCCNDSCFWYLGAIIFACSFAVCIILLATLVGPDWGHGDFQWYSLLVLIGMVVAFLLCFYFTKRILCTDDSGLNSTFWRMGTTSPTKVELNQQQITTAPTIVQQPQLVQQPQPGQRAGHYVVETTTTEQFVPTFLPQQQQQQPIYMMGGGGQPMMMGGGQQPMMMGGQPMMMGGGQPMMMGGGQQPMMMGGGYMTSSTSQPMLLNAPMMMTPNNMYGSGNIY